MNDSRTGANPSTARIMHHPVHPTLVVFPLSFLTSTLASDLAFLFSGRPFWAEVSFWLVSAGLTMGLLATTAGLVDFFTMREVRKHVSGWSHALAGTMALALAGTQVQLRWEEPAEMIWPVGILLSVIMAAIVCVTGWLGGTLTFRYGIGTYAAAPNVDERERVPPGD